MNKRSKRRVSAEEKDANIGTAIISALYGLVPALIAVIVPLLTDATLGLDDVQVTALLAPVGYADTLSFVLAPTASVSVVGDTDREVISTAGSSSR